ncbi:unnamed protein product [Mucor hiemalis]
MGSFPDIEDEYSIQDNIIDLIDPADMEYYLNDKSLAPLRKVPVCIAAAVYRMSAGNCMPYTGTPKNDHRHIGFSSYQRNESPWESYRQRNKTNHKAEDSSSCSTLESTCSSRSDSPEPKHHHRHHKKRSYQMLLREIRRLRGENAFLNSSVSILKNDLRDTTLSRQNANVIHQRTYNEYESRHQALENELLIERDEVRRLKEQVEQLQLAACSSPNISRTPSHNDNNDSLTLHDAAYFKKRNNNVFGCYEFKEDDEDLTCQPVAHDSAVPEVNIKMDELKTSDEQMVNDYFKRRFEDEDEVDFSPEDENEEEEEEDLDLEPFETAAASYICQALIAKLSSARVRLDFDDLILKHEPSTDVVMAVLAEAFVRWVSTLWLKPANKSITAQKFLTSQIQPGLVDFWKSILQCYAIDYDSQVRLLDDIEAEVKQVDKTGCPALLTHFDRLVLCLFSSEVVEKEVVLSWHSNPVNDEASKSIRNSTITTRLIDFLEEEDDEEDEDDDDEEEDDEDDMQGGEYDDDEDLCSFEFMDSPIPEENDDDINFVFAHDDEDSNNEILNNQPSDHTVEELLATKERNPCICNLNYDNDTTNSNVAGNSPLSKHELADCSCDSTYTTQSVAEKKKKSVRIAM